MMKKTAVIIAYFCLSVTLLQAVRAQKNEPNFDELEKTVNAELKEKNAAGAAIAIIKDDKIIFSKGFGTANIETNQPVTPETLFQVGSITKVFTATMLVGMAAQGKLKLDVPVGTYVRNLSPKLSKITLSQLLSHTGGVIDEPDEFGAGDESLMAGYIRSWTDDYTLFNPGEVFSYSNSGFALAGLAGQEAGGKPYAELMRERVFQPLGMKRTTFRPTEAMTYPLAVGHLAKPGEPLQVVRPLPQDARLYPAGTFYSSLNDMSRFALAYLNSGKLDGKEIIAPAVFNQMKQPHGAQLSAPDDTGYGYGLFMNTNQNIRQFYHDGSMTGYVAQMKFIPERKIAFIILGNTNNIVLDKTQNKIMELMLDLKPQPPAPAKEVHQLAEAEMAKYTGQYKQPNRWQIEIAVKDHRLYIKEFNQELPLANVGGNRFTFQFPNAPRPLEIYIQPAGPGKTGFVHQYVWAFKKLN